MRIIHCQNFYFSLSWKELRLLMDIFTAKSPQKVKTMASNMKNKHINRFFSLVRDIWFVIGITILFWGLGHYILGAANYLKDLFSEEVTKINVIEPRANSPVYENFPEKYDFWKEYLKTWDTHFEPYYHWRRNGFTGKYTNISPLGIRLTVKEGVRSGAKKIFVFGGSTLWGTGSPDGGTIPSILQSLLGDIYDIYNFGETGYVSTQELNYLLYQLSVGNIPDAVIFYDGVNDGYAGVYSPAIPRDPQNLREKDKEKQQSFFIRLFKKSNYMRLVAYLQKQLFPETQPLKKWDRKIKRDIRSNCVLVLDMYEAHIKQVKALAKAYEFEAFFFWQPNLFSLTRKTNLYEKSIIDNVSSIWIESQLEVYKVAKERLSKREHEKIYFLGNLFDEVDEPIYIDWCHVGPNGNEIVAGEIFRQIKSKL